MKVIVSKAELDKFRRRAIKSYPNERIELLWGKRRGLDTFEIFLFDQVKHERGRKWCKSDEDDHEISIQEAQDRGFVILGTIHTHPNRDEACPSESDFDDALEQGEVISGICAIWENKKTGKLKSRVRFWGPLVGVKADLR
jgi:proteasome lid subunit RPN8/RPN11